MASLIKKTVLFFAVIIAYFGLLVIIDKDYDPRKQRVEKQEPFSTFSTNIRVNKLLIENYEKGKYYEEYPNVVVLFKDTTSYKDILIRLGKYDFISAPIKILILQEKLISSIEKIELWYGDEEYFEINNNFLESEEDLPNYLITTFSPYCPVEFHDNKFSSITLKNNITNDSAHVIKYINGKTNLISVKGKFPSHQKIEFKNFQTNILELQNINHDSNINFYSLLCNEIYTDTGSISKISISFNASSKLWGGNTFPTIKTLNEHELMSVYHSIMVKFKKMNNQMDLINVDIAYQNKFNTNWIYHFFSDYGYNKSRIVYITFISLLIFIIINFILGYTKLYYSVYSIDGLFKHLHKDISQQHVIAKSNFYYCAIYTSIVFFSINIKFEKINYHNKLLLLWFAIIYIWGLVCIGFFINFIFSR